MIRAVSPSGRWAYDSGGLLAGGQSCGGITWEPQAGATDTFARFLAEDCLAVASVSGYLEPEGDGTPLWMVQVLSFDPARDWRLVALEWDVRNPHPTRGGLAPFVPKDIVWHVDGVLGWIVPSPYVPDQVELYVHKRAAPRGTVDIPLDGAPACDSDGPLDLEISVQGSWHSLYLDEEGTTLRAIDARGCDDFDLLGRRHRRDGEAFVTIDGE